eukprot:g570.t1
MTSSIVTDVILQQRFQSLERELRVAKLNVKKIETQLHNEQLISEDVKSKNQILTDALSSAQTDKLKLEAEMRTILSQRQNSDTSKTVFPASQFSNQLSQLDEKLNSVLASKSHSDGQIQELQTHLASVTAQLESKGQDLKNLEKELQRVENQKSSISIKLKFSEEKGVQQRLELEQRVEKWIQKEKEFAERTQQLITERDGFKISFEKKAMEFTKLTQTLKDTTHALGNCLTVIKKSPDLMDVLSEDGGDELVSIQEIQNSLSPVRGLIEDDRSFIMRRTGNLELGSEIEELPYEELRSRHSNLIKQYNKGVQETLLLENDRETQINFKNKAWTETSALRLQLTESRKIAQQKDEQIKALSAHIEQLDQTIESAEEAKAGLAARLESVEKTCDDFAAQVKFLLTRIEHLKESINSENPTPSKRQRVSLIGRRPDTGRCESIHDVIEENRQLKEASYRHQREKNQLIEELDVLRESKSLSFHQRVLEEEEFDPRDAPGPSKRLKTTHEELSQEDKDWKAKWEAAEFELSQLRAANVQTETQMNEVIESSTNEAMKTQEDLRRLEQGVMEYRAKYEALLESYKSQGVLYQSDSETKGAKLRELEALVKAMTAEIDTQKLQNNELKQMSANWKQNYDSEKSAFAELQERMISTEAEHLQEIKQIKAQMEAQITSNLNLLTTETVQRDPQNTQSGGHGLRLEEMERLLEQLKDKDRVIMDLEKRLQLTMEPLRDDVVHDLQCRITLLEASVNSEQNQKDLIQRTLLHSQNQHKTEVEALREETTLLVKEKDARITKLMLDLEESHLQITNLKRVNEELESTVQSLREEHANQSRTHLEQTEMLKLNLNALREENETLKKELTLKSAEIVNKSEVINSLRATGNVAVEQLKQLEKEKNDLNSRLKEQEARLATTISKSIHIEGHPVNSEPSLVQTTPLVNDTTNEANEKAELPVSSKIPVSEALQDTEKAKNETQRVQGASHEVPQKLDLSSLLEIAKNKYHSVHSESSNPVQSLEGQTSSSGGSQEEPSPVQGLTERIEGSKPAKWTPVIYTAGKKTDQNDDKKKDRSQKH